jgi:hypothetical protein
MVSIKGREKSLRNLKGWDLHISRVCSSTMGRKAQG